MLGGFGRAGRNVHCVRWYVLNDAMQALIAEEGGNFKLAAWDWRYYAEKLRQRRADFDPHELDR